MDDLEVQNHIKPTVSVLVTVFNREKYLAAAIESILESTWRDFEIIIVDDASSDDSLSIAKTFDSNDSRVTALANEKNLGDYGNRAKAAGLARGKYIKYLDSDDLIYPHSLAIMVESMEAFPDAALGLSHSMPEDEFPYPWCLSPEEAYEKHFGGRGCLSCGPSGAIIRRDAFELVGGFQAEWKVISDFDLWFRLASRWSTVLLPPGLVWWRRHENQEFTMDNNDIVYLKRGYQLNQQALTGVDCPLSSAQRANALERSRQHFARKLLSMAIRKKKLNLAFDVFRDTDLKITDLLKGFREYR